MAKIKIEIEESFLERLEQEKPEIEKALSKYLAKTKNAVTIEELLSSMSHLLVNVVTSYSELTEEIVKSSMEMK